MRILGNIIASVIVISIIIFFIYAIKYEIDFNKDCTQQGGIAVIINDTYTCIEKPKILFVK